MPPQQVKLVNRKIVAIPASSKKMKRRRTFSESLILVLISISLPLASIYPCYSQKYVVEHEQTWIGYYNQLRLTGKSGLWTDLHLRLTDHYTREKAMLLTRIGYIYYANDRVRLAGGYTYAHRYNQLGVRRVPEHRPWQQIQWVSRKIGFDFTEAFRLEQRFRKDGSSGSRGFSFNWRLRYTIAFMIPLKDKVLRPKAPYLLLSNEININAGKQIVNNYFDQNRSFAGLGYQFSPKLHANVGYLFIFQQDARPQYYNRTHAIRLFVYHNVDFRD